MANIVAVQNSNVSVAALTARRSRICPLMASSDTLLPVASTDLNFQLLTTAHAEQAEHRTISSNCHALRKRFTWTDFHKNIPAFVSSSVLFTLLESGECTP